MQNIFPRPLQCSIWWESTYFFIFCTHVNNNYQFVSYRDNFLCDVVLSTTDHQEFHAHKLILASCSPYFFAMFNSFEESRQNRIVLKDVDPKALSLLLEYVYTSKIHLSEENVQVIMFILYSKVTLDIKSNFFNRFYCMLQIFYNWLRSRMHALHFLSDSCILLIV